MAFRGAPLGVGTDIGGRHAPLRLQALGAGILSEKYGVIGHGRLSLILFPFQVQSASQPCAAAYMASSQQLAVYPTAARRAAATRA